MKNDTNNVIYVVVACYSREIECVGVSGTLEGAQKILEDDFLQIYSDQGLDPKELKSNGVGMLSSHGMVGTGYAWINGFEENFDWQIIKIDT